MAITNLKTGNSLPLSFRFWIVQDCMRIKARLMPREEEIKILFNSSAKWVNQN
jgi:hypothetical protein